MEGQAMVIGTDRSDAGLATAIGIVGFGAVGTLALLFTVGEPFGRINDVCNGALGVLSGAMALRLRSNPRTGGGTAAAASAVVGAAVTVAGSALVVSGTTGFFLAGLVSSVGFGLIGLWLVTLSRALAVDERWPRRLAPLGIAAGASMALGLLAAPGVAMRLDDMNTAPAWVWVAMVGWLGSFVLYPAWAIWFGRRAQATPMLAPA
jgi:hypothetical protein